MRWAILQRLLLRMTVSVVATVTWCVLSRVQLLWCDHKIYIYLLATSAAGQHLEHRSFKFEEIG